MSYKVNAYLSICLTFVYIVGSFKCLTINQRYNMYLKNGKRKCFLRSEMRKSPSYHSVGNETIESETALAQIFNGIPMWTNTPCLLNFFRISYVFLGFPIFIQFVFQFCYSHFQFCILCF